MATHPLTFLTAVALAATAAAQAGWVQRFPTTRPVARGYHAMVYDLVRGTMLMFGGSNLTPLADTWEWNGANWVARSPAHSPSARFGHALAVDLNRGRVVLFGGSTGSEVNDTWEYDGNDWVRITTQNQPSVRRLARMEYDAVRARIVLFGGGVGLTFGSPLYGDTWEWNGVAWTARMPATSPSPRLGHGMVYNFARARIVLTGGGGHHSSIPLGDTWTWDGTNWSQVLAAAPAPTTALGLANDTAHDVVVRFGGTTGAETWLFDHTSWRRDPRSLIPATRSWSPLAHDIPRGRTVLFGGISNVSPAFLDDTWEYDPGVLAQWTRSGSGCAGTSGVPALQPVGASLPIVGATFVLELLGVPGSGAAISIGFSDQQWNGNTLPWDLGALGMTACTLHVSPDFVFFAPVIAGRAALTWQLPNDPGLIGTRFFDQGFALDPAANPLGAIVSNAGAGIVGPF